MRTYRGIGNDRTLITTIECISVDFRALLPMIIQPTSTHRANWITYPTPSWHYSLQGNGYADTAISIEQLIRVFDPQTKAIAKGDVRLLINDGFGTYNSAEIQRFCYKNNIILARLPLHTSHKLQPCDVGPFAPLKTYYREEVERLYRGGSQHIGKPHFTRLYDRARRRALTPRNIRLGWRNTGLFPFDPNLVLDKILQLKLLDKIDRSTEVTVIVNCDKLP